MSDIIEGIQEKLWQAAKEGNCAVIRSLVVNGADIYARDPHGRTALNIATQYGKADAATTLLAAKELKYMVGLGMSPEEILPETKAEKLLETGKKKTTKKRA